MQELADAELLPEAEKLTELVTDGENDPELDTDAEYDPDAEKDAEGDECADDVTDTLPVRLGVPETLAVVD